MRLGTTRGTNALLTRRGARTAFVTTRGLGDVLRIGYQNRPKLFELAIKKPQPLFAARRRDRRANRRRRHPCLQAPNAEQVRAELLRLKAAGIESLAICLLNSYANPQHEELVERIARELGFAEISVQHAGLAADEARAPRRHDRRRCVSESGAADVCRAAGSSRCPGSDLRLMTSAGGLAGSGQFTGKDSILSGPAGGVVGFSRVAEAAGFTKAIGFDMGGTSTDVAALRRPLRVRIRNAKGRRADRRADAGDRNGRRRRRLDLPLRRREAGRRPRQRRRRPRPRLLRPRRPADRHRLQL